MSAWTHISYVLFHSHFILPYFIFIYMKGFFCLDKKTTSDKKPIPDPGEIYKRNPKQKTSGAGPGFSEKVTKEPQTKFQNPQVFKNPKYMSFFILPG